METHFEENCTDWSLQHSANQSTHTCLQFNDSILADDQDVGDTNSTFSLPHLISDIVHWLICITGLIGNTLIIYLIIRFKKLRSITNVCILNLAISDLIFLLLLTEKMTQHHWAYGNFLCKAYFLLESTSQLVIPMMLIVLSADRYLLLCHRGKWRGKSAAVLVITGAWIFAACVSLPLFAHATTFDIGDKDYCNMFWPDWNGTAGHKIYVFRSLILKFAIPLPIILILNVLIARQLCRSVATPEVAETAEFIELHEAQGEGRETESAVEASRSLSKLVIVLGFTYFFCWVPYWTNQIKGTFFPRPRPATPVPLNKNFIALNLFFGCLSYSVPAINPILYFCFSKELRKFLKIGLPCVTIKGEDK